MRLYQKTIQGSAWTVLARATQGLLAFVKLIVLGRILEPHDFGLMGIALLVVAFLEIFSQTGFQQALIQREGDIEPYLDSAWSLLVLRGLFLSGIVLVFAPFAAMFFQSPDARLIIQVCGLSFLIESLANIGVVTYQKELEFNRQVLWQLSGVVADFAVAIVSALLLRSVWAIVLGLLAGSLTRCIVSYIVHPYRPRFVLDSKKTTELWRFGRWVFGSGIVIFIITKGDDIVIGRVLGVASLGLYQMAYRIANMPATEITNVVAQVTFPAYSKIQNDAAILKQAYLRVLQMVAFLALPVAALIFLTAPLFARLFLGDKWMPMVPALQALSLFGAVRSIGATIGPLLYSTNRPKLQTQLSSIQLALMVIIIYPLTVRYGILGTSAAVIIPNVLILLIAIGQMDRIIQCGYRDFARAVSMPCVGVAAMVLAYMVGETVLLPAETVLHFFVLGAVVASVYAGSTFLLGKIAGYTTWQTVCDIFRNVKTKGTTS